jgi:hypothetical protein
MCMRHSYTMPVIPGIVVPIRDEHMVDARPGRHTHTHTHTHIHIHTYTHTHTQTHTDLFMTSIWLMLAQGDFSGTGWPTALSAPAAPSSGFGAASIAMRCGCGTRVIGRGSGGGGLLPAGSLGGQNPSWAFSLFELGQNLTKTFAMYYYNWRRKYVLF